MADFHVQGKKIVLEMLNTTDSTYYPFACTQSLSYTEETEQLPATSANSGTTRRFKPGLTSGKISLAGVLFLQAVSKWTALDVMIEQLRQNGVSYKITATDDNAYFRTISGNANIASSTITGEAGQVAKFNIDFVCDGPIIIDGAISNPSSTDVKPYLYIASGGENTITHADAAGRTIILVLRAGYPYEVITSGTPTGYKVLYNSGSGTFTFSSSDPFTVSEHILIQYR